MTVRNLDALLAPRSVVLVGASRRLGSVGNTVARNMLRAGFHGRLELVSPKGGEMDGQPVRRSVAELAEPADLAVIATPPATLPGLIAELAAAGTRAAVVITAGLDGETRARMLEAGRAMTFRILGPNGIGLMLPALGLDATFSHRAASPGNLAFLSQSGALVTAIVDRAAEHGIGFSHVVSLGDMADVDFGDLIDYLAGDASCHAILLYMEAATGAAKLLSAARRAARVKPVVVVKSGRHAVAAKAAQSHTGRLAGSDAAYEAAFSRAGIVRVSDLHELLEAAETLSRVGRLESERLLVLTNGGGAGVLAADRLADHGGELAILSAPGLRRLDGLLPANWSRANPVDIIGDAGPDRFRAALEVLLDEPEPAALLVVQCPTALASGDEIAEAVIEGVAEHRQNNGKVRPVLTCWLGGPAAAEPRRRFAAAGLATFDTPGAAARGFSQLVRHARARRQLLAVPPPMPASAEVDREGARALVATALARSRNGTAALSEVEGKALLAHYGIPVVETLNVATAGEVETAAAALLERSKAAGLALKVLSPDVIHKSDVGGVRLDIATPARAREEAERMAERVARHVAGARLEGFSLSPMVDRTGGHETILGASVDPTFGPLLLFGAGGVAVEALADTAVALPPLDMALAHALIERTRIHRLLRGYRDRPAADLEALAEALVRLGWLIAEHPEIRELDINPLLAGPAGVVALDARVRLVDAKREPRTPMAITPYPAALEKLVTLDGLGPVRLRPIRPEDARLYGHFMAHVSPEAGRLRFHAPKRELTADFVARMTQIDYAREMAFVALSAATGEMLGVARYLGEPDMQSAEYAILVRTDVAGRGLGWLLMQALVAEARAKGIRELWGVVLAENTAMLRMCAELGFSIEPEDGDASVRRVSLRT
jgi:acetyltransferase